MNPNRLTGGRNMIWETVDGINIWKLSRYFKKLSASKLTLEDKVLNDVLVVTLPLKKSNEPTAPETRKQIEETILHSDGFETLKVALLENCRPAYKEMLTKYGVRRWLEIPVEENLVYKFSFENIKESSQHSSYQMPQGGGTSGLAAR
jgi:hypothetical protein